MAALAAKLTRRATIPEMQHREVGPIQSPVSSATIPIISGVTAINLAPSLCMVASSCFPFSSTKSLSVRSTTIFLPWVVDRARNQHRSSSCTQSPASFPSNCSRIESGPSCIVIFSIFRLAQHWNAKHAPRR